MQIDRCFSFKNDEELVDCIKKLKTKNRSGYLIPSIRNYKGCDAFFFLHNSQRTNINLDFWSDKDLLIFIQIKKDYDIIFSENEDIQLKFQEKKKELLGHNIIDIQIAFLLISEYKGLIKHKTKKKINVDGDEVLFLFTNEDNNDEIFQIFKKK